MDTFYPQRPQELEDVCLYDFVADYDWQGLDDQGRRKYRKLMKPRLPNHKFFDPENQSQREDYYYSLVLLFSPSEMRIVCCLRTKEQKQHSTS